MLKTYVAGSPTFIYVAVGLLLGECWPKKRCSDWAVDGSWK